MSGPAWATRAGFAPEITEPEEALRFLEQAITGAGYRTGKVGVPVWIESCRRDEGATDRHSLASSPAPEGWGLRH
jgi:enolase